MRVIVYGDFNCPFSLLPASGWICCVPAVIGQDGTFHPGTDALRHLTDLVCTALGDDDPERVYATGPS